MIQRYRPRAKTSRAITSNVPTADSQNPTSRTTRMPRLILPNLREKDD